MRKLLIVLLLIALAVPAALAEDEDFSIFDLIDEEVILDEETEETEVAEPDGSVVLTLTFTGDFTIGKSTGTDHFDYFGNELKNHDDINFTMEKIRDDLLADDLTVVNFEGTLTNSKYIPPNKKQNHFLFSAPPEWASVLSDNGIEVATLENNHVMDHGEEAFNDTKNALNSVGVIYSTTSEPAICNVKGVDVCVLAYYCIDRYEKPIDGFKTLYEKVEADIRTAKTQYPIVVTAFHWGNEKDYAPTANQIKMGRLAVDAGADLVVGHHSHRMQPIECYNGVYICYSLGNFCFAGHKKPDDMSSFVFQTRFRVLDGQAVNEGFRIIPIRISSRKDANNFIPTPLTDVTAIDSVITTLKTNGRKLPYAVDEYPTEW